ncbi:MAG: amino acid adenylation domain-containing protein [Nostoc sp.]|uniref:amino acid adenylation domain-containing protein n=1 Tax=Nostoc sp. TaxID=1180 RepID=UPI002FFC2D4D
MQLNKFSEIIANSSNKNYRYKEIEAAIRSSLYVDDCVVVERQTKDFKRELVAYIVPSGLSTAEQLLSHLQKILPNERIPKAIALVSTIPLKDTGQVDEATLSSLEVIDSGLTRHIEEQLQSLSAIERVTVVAEPRVRSIPPVHLEDLLGETQLFTSENNQQELQVTAPNQQIKKSSLPSSKKLAISYGEPLQLPQNAPKTLAQVLKQAAECSTRGIIYIQPDGSEKVQSYKELWQNAQQILAGLRKLGLKPQDKVIFQLEDNQDFICAFWGCVLGGFVPVPISIAPTYEQVNSTISKLQNTWQMLEKPLVLTSTSLAPKICSLSKLLNLKSFQVESIDHLRECKPDSNWHSSQPEDLAILLLTSGSTGTPKAVMQSHGSLINCCVGIAAMNGFTPEDVWLHWVPLDHVGGIVMCHIKSVYLGCQQIHAPTQLVLQEPTRWLDWISFYRATITWAPNFAYGLINEQIEKLKTQANSTWDLSSMRFIINGGEAIAAKTARRFLQLLEPFHLSTTAIHPAWGMSETSSGVTYSDSFLLDAITDKQKFVEVGAPIPGFAMRIVDDQNQVVEEQTIGQLQVKGASVTSGYYQNSQANQEAFTSDGWFNTGDLGFLDRGRLTITGRQKDVIIINGLNYYCHEIEAAVEEIPGVEVSYTAACGVRQPEINTDKLAIFFNTALTDDASLLALIKEIRIAVVNKVGVNPDYLIPVNKEIIPKTAIGKIQRSQLSQRFNKGEFISIIKRIDILLANANTIPDWFYRQVWRTKSPITFNSSLNIINYTLVFLDPFGLGTYLCQILSERNLPYIAVSLGEDFRKINRSSYTINPDKTKSYQLLLESLAADNIIIGQILHLWTYDKYIGEVTSLNAIEQAQKYGIYSLLFLVKALAKVQGDNNLVQLLFVSSHLQSIASDSPVAYEKSPVLGLLKTISQELTDFNCRHIDLPFAGVKENGNYILQEMQVSSKEREVAYRNGQRFVPRLEKVDLTKEPLSSITFKQEGTYLIAGGFGGIGIEIVRYLLKNYQSRLLLVGRNPLPQKHTWHEAEGDTAKRLAAYQELEQLGGEIIYEAVDICDLKQLQIIVEKAKSRWGKNLDGILHLAGTFHEQLVVEETQENLAAVLRSKVLGAWVLHQLVKDNHDTIFINFSSVYGLFGSIAVGAYAAANSFLNCFSHYQNSHSKLASYCLSWSMWDDIGMSQGKGYQMKNLLRAKGYCVMSSSQAISSMLASLQRQPTHLLIGLDGSNQNIQRLQSSTFNLQKLTAYFTTNSNEVFKLADLQLQDRFGTSCTCNLVKVPEIPCLENGEIDRARLIREINSQEIRERIEPRNEVELKIAQCWQDVMPVPLLGIHDNFFELGGNSLLATQVVSRINLAFQTSLPVQSLFRSPTIASLSEAIATQLQTGSGLILPAIAPFTRNADIPLSWAQERLWFLHQLEGESGAYTIPFAVRLVGNLNIQALKEAFQKIVQRHEVLRTCFQVKDNKPLQVIASNVSITLPVVDLQNVAEPWQQVEQQAVKEAYKPFDLTKDPVLRVKIWQVAKDEYVILFAIHHIAADGWSKGVLIREVSAHYRAITTGSSVALPELPVQYADFTLWQRQWLTQKVLERQLTYWKQKLAGAPSVLELPTDHPRPAIQTFRGGIERFQIDSKLTSTLRQLSQDSGGTLFMTLLAGFVVLLSRYTGQTDLVVGSPIANRNRQETEGLIGFFVNTLALRFNLSQEATFQALLEQVRQVTQNAYDNQDLPFEMLVEELHLERNLDRNPLVQVMFALQNAPVDPWDLPGLKVEDMPWGLNGVRFDIEVHFFEVPKGLEGICYYSSDLFDAQTIARMMQHFQNLLAAIVSNPEQPVNELSLLTAQEKQQLLIEWNNTYTNYPSNQCIHQLFTAQVERTPDAVAVVFGEQQLTYRELNIQANQLAHYLQKLGVKPGVLVGICIERSVSMVVGLLAILKAGGAYVPLDTEYPKERLTFIVEDTQLSVLLTTEKLADGIPKHQGCVVCFDTDAAAIAQESQQSPTAQVTSDDLAYVIYTSGSTGQPKGVAVTHRAVNRLVLNTNYINIESTDVIAQAANCAFDAATFEIWGALLNGARLVGVSKELSLSPRNLAAFLRSQGISVLFLTTALFNQIAQEVPSAFSSLKHLLFGGEAVDPKWVKEVLKNGAPQRLLHVYGPTENTTFTSWYLVEEVSENATTIPIGQPISNTQIYVLDSQLQPVGIGVPGELYIGGDGLAKEYLNRKDLTKEKFIPNPFNEAGGSTSASLGDQRQKAGVYKTGDRLYKTGDKVRYLSDGNIEFLGRIDYQVKIRGFRIELGEIETVLSQHPLVQESVVVVREDTPGDTCTEHSRSVSDRRSRSKRLVAYLVPALHSQTLPQQVAQWQSEYVNDWLTLYEQLYNQASADDVTFNIAGWNSSYTKQPIPEWEMQEWVENTTSRIQANLPQRVLEIGCGTGLLLSRIAKNCQQYWGTDYSIAAIQHVEQVCSTVEGLNHVQLRHQMADNFEGIPQGDFDTVVLNSIVQYFPSVEYLLQVIEGAIAAIGDRGTLFVGDVRSLPLLEPYHAAVQLFQAESNKTIEQWQQQVHYSVAIEEELVIDPGFFIALQTRFPQISWVEIQPKRGNSLNELTQFRYDVTLHIGTDVRGTVAPWLNWQLDKLSFAQIQNYLQQEKPELLGIRRVPNQRVQQALEICQWLENPPGVATVEQLRQLLAQQPTVGINPEQFYQLGQQLGYTVHPSCWESSQDGCYDVVFCRNQAHRAIAFWNNSAVTTKSWTDYTNNPLHGKLAQKLVPLVREFLQQKLPDYMVPQAFVLLNALPLTPNGKVDRRALPTPDTANRNLSTGFVLPRTPIEAQLAQIWSEVLRVERIGVKDNFFELGGHSLLATQVLSEINSVFGLNLSIQTIFESPTVAGIAAYIEIVDLITQDLSVKEVSSEVVEF